MDIYKVFNNIIKYDNLFFFKDNKQFYNKIIKFKLN